MTNSILKNKYFIFFLILALILLPGLISKNAQGDSEVIITALAIDKKETEYDVSMQIFTPMPSQTFAPVISTINAVGTNLADSFTKVEIRLGKRIAFAHCRILVISDSLDNENIISVLDYINRSKINTNSIVVINTPDSAKDFLASSSDYNNGLYFASSDQSSFRHFSYLTYLNLGQFISNYYAPYSCSLINRIGLTSPKEIGQASPSGQTGTSSGTSQTSGDSSGSTEEQKVLNNTGEGAVYKNGRKALNIAATDMKKFVWFQEALQKNIFLNNYTDEIYNNANIVANISQSYLSQSVWFENDVPHYKLTLNIFGNVSEIYEAGMNKVIQSSETTLMTPSLNKALTEQVSQEYFSAIKILQDNNIDFLKFYNLFYKFENKKFNELLKNIPEDSYMSKIVFEIGVTLVEAF